jgi:hypothetical protein
LISDRFRSQPTLIRLGDRWITFAFEPRIARGGFRASNPHEVTNLIDQLPKPWRFSQGMNWLKYCTKNINP